MLNVIFVTFLVTNHHPIVQGYVVVDKDAHLEE
jgi:hypothetical protein